MERKTHEFERNSVVLFLLIMCGNLCNYIFQIVMGNLMPVEEYAQLNTVISLVGILSIPTTILTVICARYAAINSADMGKSDDAVRHTLWTLVKFAGIIAIVLAVATLPSARAIASVFSLNRAGYVRAVLGVAIVNLAFAIVSGTLQGTSRFVPYGVMQILTAAGKLAFGMVLVLAGCGVYGATGAIAVGIVLAICYGLRYMGGQLWRAVREHPRGGMAGEFVRYSVGAIVAQGCVIAMTNGDVLLVKAFFSDYEAGVYASASVLGKIAMYLSTAVVAALFPMVVEKNSQGKNTLSLLWRAMLYGGGMAIAVALVMVLGGKFLVGILFGERYIDAVALLPFVCAYVVVLTFVTVLMNYLLAINRVKVFDVTMLVTLVAMIAAAVLRHRSVRQLLMICAFILLAALLFDVIWMMFVQRLERHHTKGGSDDSI